MTTNTYKCNFCSRGYQRKIYYSRHVAICELMCKSIKERKLETEETDDTPSVRMLYDVILEMANKMSLMEKKMNELSKWADLKKRKLNVITWLNENTHEDIKPFEEFIGNIRVERKHLEYLFKNDYTSAILCVIQEFLPLENDELNPIKAFIQKPNILYVFANDPTNCLANGLIKDGTIKDGMNTWSIITPKSLQQLINIVSKQLLDEFIKWQKENSAKMEQDEFAVRYAENVIKMMGGKMTREQVLNRIKLDLYKYLKVQMKHITAVEIE
jgi:hypothetical protein